jgi:hypothetical protein
MIYESRPTEVAVYDNDHPDGPFAEAALKLKLEPDRRKGIGGGWRDVADGPMTTHLANFK